MTKIAIVYYSLYGHIATLAESLQIGIQAAGGTCDIYQVAETLSDEILGKMHAPPKKDYPIATADTLIKYDGFLFGLSGRFGTFPAQMKTLFDACGQHWANGALVGKAAGTFTSVAVQGGGQETVNLSCLPFFTHQGMVFVPMGPTTEALNSFDEVHGASFYGCGTFAGPDGMRTPSALEKTIAESHGKFFYKITSKLAA